MTSKYHYNFHTAKNCTVINNSNYRIILGVKLPGSELWILTVINQRKILIENEREREREMPVTV